MASSDYISREEALSLIDRYWQQAYNAHFLDAAVRLGSVYREMEDIPAADVRPVVRGYWHGEGDGYADGELVYDMWQCSCCGERFDEWDDKPTWNFCPVCGADMRPTSMSGTNREKS